MRSALLVGVKVLSFFLQDIQFQAQSRHRIQFFRIAHHFFKNPVFGTLYCFQSNGFFFLQTLKFFDHKKVGFGTHPIRKMHGNIFVRISTVVAASSNASSLIFTKIMRSWWLGLQTGVSGEYSKKEPSAVMRSALLLLC